MLKISHINNTWAKVWRYLILHLAFSIGWPLWISLLDWMESWISRRSGSFQESTAFLSQNVEKTKSWFCSRWMECNLISTISNTWVEPTISCQTGFCDNGQRTGKAITFIGSMAHTEHNHCHCSQPWLYMTNYRCLCFTDCTSKPRNEMSHINWNLASLPSIWADASQEDGGGDNSTACDRG